MTVRKACVALLIMLDKVRLTWTETLKLERSTKTDGRAAEFILQTSSRNRRLYLLCLSFSPTSETLWLFERGRKPQRWWFLPEASCRHAETWLQEGRRGSWGKSVVRGWTLPALLREALKSFPVETPTHPNPTQPGANVEFRKRE